MAVHSPPDTSGVTQMHDQINNRLHEEYEKSKSELYSEMSNLNRESFMTILGDIWNKWATPDLIIKSGKRVGISSNGLNVNWMQQDKFRRAEALLEPTVSSPPSSSHSTVVLSSPVGVRKGTSGYYLHKLNESLDLIDKLQSTSVTPDEIPGLLSIRKIAPKKTKAKRVTQVCGSMRANEMLAKVQEIKAQEKEKEEKRKINAQKEDLKITFIHCKDMCVCEGKNKCAAAGLKMCEVCNNVLRST